MFLFLMGLGFNCTIMCWLAAGSNRKLPMMGRSRILSETSIQRMKSCKGYKNYLLLMEKGKQQKGESFLLMDGFSGSVRFSKSLFVGKFYICGSSQQRLENLSKSIEIGSGSL